jgi:antitoxin MazE
MNVQIEKWGNSLGVRIPAGLARELGLQEGSELDLQNRNGQLVLRPILPPNRRYHLDALLADVRPDQVHEAIDWGATAGQETL